MLALPETGKATYKDHTRPFYQYLDTNNNSMVFIKDFAGFYENILRPKLDPLEQHELLRAAMYSNVQLLNDGQAIKDNTVVEGYPIDNLAVIFKPFITNKGDLSAYLTELPAISENYAEGVRNTNEIIPKVYDNNYKFNGSELTLFQWLAEYASSFALRR